MLSDPHSGLTVTGTAPIRDWVPVDEVNGQIRDCIVVDDVYGPIRDCIVVFEIQATTGKH